jgi:DNA-directed RNA polymerase subunit RPC12/RpoP
MSDFKFNCPSCGQHLSGDERYAGLQIVCPSCGKAVVVPAAPAGAAAVRMVPPASGVPAPLAPRLPQKTCGLAAASLVCSIGALIVGPFGFIPGIICGHMARKKIAATPGLQGGGLAKAGLIIGYIALGITVLAVIAVMVFFFFIRARMQQMSPGGQFQPSVISTQSGGVEPAERETTDTEPDGSGWMMKLTGVAIPSAPVTGRIHGQPFKMEKVTLENGFLNFRQGSDFFADREIDVVVFNDATTLSGRTFTVPKKEFGSSPHIWMKWKEAGQDMPKQKNFMDRYALRLEFGALSGGKLPGKIYLCVPDQEKSFVAGTFEAVVKDSR